MKSMLNVEENHRILVVDDNRAIHDDLRKILARCPEDRDMEADEEVLFGAAPVAMTQFELDSAYQGQEGLEKVQKSLAEGRPYAVAFVDIRMPPGWDGIETVARLWETDPKLQAVLCTAYSDYSWSDIRRKLGCTENLLILKKPFDNIEVVQIAHALTAKWRAGVQASARLADLDRLVSSRTADLQYANERIFEQLQERTKAEESLRTIFETSPVGIMIADRNGRYLDVNRAFEQQYGLEKRDVIGKDAVQLGWLESSEVLASINREAERGGVNAREVSYTHRELGRRTGLLWVRSVTIGGVQHTLRYTIDITARKQMEEDLRQARAGAEAAATAKTAFLANMSHEIRTPLNGVLGLSTLLDDEDVPENIRSMIRLIRTSGEMLRSLLDDVLDFSKIESGKLELEQRPFALRDCLEWSLGLFRKAAMEKSLDLKLNYDGAIPPLLMGDATRLQQVVANLVGNAVKFTSQGAIEVGAALASAEAAGGRCSVRVWVSDTGIGIPEDRRDRLFKLFTQVDASTNRRYGGTGLGLAISKRLVELMGGEIGVESEAGKGTRFHFTFLAAKATDAKPACAAAGRTLHSLNHILIVEDNAVNQLVAVRMIRKLGCDGEVVSDGEAAVRLAEKALYDLILMDIQMPGIDGREASRRIRALNGEAGRVPIVALTASATTEDRDLCYAAGMNDYLSKPLDLEALRKALERWSEKPESADKLVGPSGHQGN